MGADGRSGQRHGVKFRLPCIPVPDPATGSRPCCLDELVSHRSGPLRISPMYRCTRVGNTSPGLALSVPCNKCGEAGAPIYGLLSRPALDLKALLHFCGIIHGQSRARPLFHSLISGTPPLRIPTAPTCRDPSEGIPCAFEAFVALVVKEKAMAPGHDVCPVRS